MRKLATKKVLALMLSSIWLASCGTVATDDDGKSIFDNNNYFDRNFGGKLKEQAFALMQDEDKTYLSAGFRQISHNNYDAWLVKTDAKGFKLWDKRFGSEAVDIFYDIAKANDGGYIAVGKSYRSLEQNYSDAWITKIDQNGKQIWQKYYGTETNSEQNKVKNNSDFAAVEVLKDGYMIVGNTVQNGKSIPTLTKTNNKGEQIWQKSFKAKDQIVSQVMTLKLPKDAFSNSVVYALAKMSDGGFAIAGSQAAPDAMKTFISDTTRIFRVDANGEKLWDKQLNNGWNFMRGGQDIALDIVANDDDSLVFVGFATDTNAQFNTRVVKLNANGEKIWDKNYKSSEKAANNESYAIVRTSDKGYLLTGKITSESKQEQGLIMKLDADGKQLWYKQFGGDNDDGFKAVISNAKNHFVFAGYKSKSATDKDFWLLETDFQGKISNF